MNGFSDKVKQKLGYYVYALADPRDNKIFYIGKGINNRIFQHEEKLEESAQIIDQLSALIAQDYQKFVADDLDDIDVEISVAKQSLKRDNKHEPEQKE